jgi:FixJ family two-component response regulator
MSPSANISEAPLVLIVDDDVSVRRSTARLLRSSGMRAESFASVQHLLDSESTIEADCLILDIRMPGIDELQLMRRLMANSQRIVDDDASVANSTCRLIRSLGMRGEAFFSGADLLNSGRATEASCVILDVRMPNLDGLQLRRRLKEIRPSIRVIFFSAHAGKEEEDQALRSGALAFLRKPVHRDDLLRVIRMALERTS